MVSRKRRISLCPLCPDSYRDVVSFVAKEVTSTQSLHEGHDVAQIIFLETKPPFDYFATQGKISRITEVGNIKKNSVQGDLINGNSLLIKPGTSKSF